MGIKDVIASRVRDDQAFDGFFDFVESGRVGKYRIVRRDTKSLYGLADESDNIVVPLVYDSLECKAGYIESKVVLGKGTFKGVILFDEPIRVLPAQYIYISRNYEQGWFTCYDGVNWTLLSKDGKLPITLSRSLLPFDTGTSLCVLRKIRTDCYMVECWDENGNHSHRRLREMSRQGEIPNRIKLVNKFYNLLVYADIYGNLLFANRELDTIIA